MSYTMDANGNPVARGGDSFGYDQANRLVSATVESLSSTYGWDGDQQQAQAAARILRREGHAVVVRLGGDDINWLVLVSHPLAASPEHLETLRARLEELATTNGGEYDGFELPT